MSDVGLSSNIYKISNRYLDHFNKFLVEVNYRPNDISAEHSSSVENILKKLWFVREKHFECRHKRLISQNVIDLQHNTVVSGQV